MKTKKIAKVDQKPNGQYRVQWAEETTYTKGVWKGKKNFNFLGSRTFNLRKDAETFAKKMRR